MLSGIFSRLFNADKETFCDDEQGVPVDSSPASTISPQASPSVSSPEASLLGSSTFTAAAAAAAAAGSDTSTPTATVWPGVAFPRGLHETIDEEPGHETRENHRRKEDQDEELAAKLPNWPRTASGDTLEQLLGLNNALNMQLPVQQSQAMPPTAWPRTLSGDDLESAIRDIAANNNNSKNNKSRQASPPEAGTTPAVASTIATTIEEVQKPIFWPRTCSGDNLEEAMAILYEASPAASSKTLPALAIPRALGNCSTSPAIATVPVAAAEAAVVGSPTAESPGSRMDSTPQQETTVCRLADGAEGGGFQGTTDCSSCRSARKAGGGGGDSGGAGDVDGGSCSSLDVAPPPPPPLVQAPHIEEVSPPAPPFAPASPSQVTKVVSLLDALGEPDVGSPQRPTKGSWGHKIGKCKPCAFLYTKGCVNGVNCEFCHLCGRGEKKRRQREKWQEQRVTQAVAVAQAELMAQAQAQAQAVAQAEAQARAQLVAVVAAISTSHSPLGYQQATMMTPFGTTLQQQAAASARAVPTSFFPPQPPPHPALWCQQRW